MSTRKIVLSIIAIEKFGETFLSQLCTIFLESNKVNEALQVLLKEYLLSIKFGKTLIFRHRDRQY